MDRWYTNSFIICCLHSMTLYGITFFNLAPQSLEFHARMDVVNDPVAMQANMQSHTQLTWQAPPAPTCQLTIATQQIDTKNSIQPHIAHPVTTKTAPVIPSFAPWQKTILVSLKPAPYEASNMISPNALILIQYKNNACTVLLVDKTLRLVALQKYTLQLRSKRGHATSGKRL